MYNFAYVVPGEGMTVRDLEFVGSSLDDLRAFPEDVKHDVGVALMEVQFGARQRAPHR